MEGKAQHVTDKEQDWVLPEEQDLVSLCECGPMLLAMTGLPASGKTTWSQRLLAEAPCFSRVNSDDLRAEHPRSHEAHIRRLRDIFISRILEEGNSVVVDNTNLRGWNDLRRLARQYGARFGVKDLRNVSWQECIKRDHDRAARGERATGRSVIIRMAMQSGLFTLEQVSNREAIIIDLDGTLSDTSHRIHHLAEGTKKNWKAFFEGIEGDTVDRAVAIVYRMAVASGYTVLLVTGRPEDYRAVSENWLTDNGFDDYFALFMRSQGDQKADTEVKSAIYDRFIAPYFDVVFTVDDRPAVVEMWREKGLACFQVAGS